MRVYELAQKLRARGLTVREVAGWQNRGYEFPVRPDGAMRHWTAGPKTGGTPTLGVVTNGRKGLAGPLCNVYQSRLRDANGLDIVYVVASGKANHAGVGNWNGMSGNYDFLGLEIEWSGPTEAFANVGKRKLTSELVMRALLDCAQGTNPNDACEHREYAKPAGRKIDTNLDGNELRRRMAELAKKPAPAPKPTPAPSKPTSTRDRLRGGEMLKPGQWITSNNKCFSLHHQADGNVVMYIGPLHRPDTAVWTTRTNGKKTTGLHMQPDGNLVLYNGTKVVWTTGTHKFPGAYFVMQDDGNAVIYQGGKARWDTKGNVR